MTMLSFRIDSQDAGEAQVWADRLGVPLSELLRDALRRRLVRLRAEDDVAAWIASPATEEEQTLGLIADWGPAEDWSEWAHATG